MEDRKYKIYVLMEPDGFTIRYVGYTGKTLETRLDWHIKDGKKLKFHRANWIKGLLKNEQFPIIKLIEDGFTLLEAKQKEIYFIKYFKEQGINLTNGTPGGDGNSNPSDEIKKKISETLKAGYASGRVKKQRPNLGKSLSKQWKKNISTGGSGLKRSTECRNNISNSKIGDKNFSFGKFGEASARYGKLHSPESKLKISKAGIGRKSLRKGTGQTVLQFDLDNNFINKYISCDLIFPKSNIFRCCKGITKTAYGFIWKFENNNIQI
jgi:hypothetical protein